ncbi:MAG: nitroreductase [Dehalococcoidia bacterium]
MNVNEAVNTRRSIRAFKPDPVPPEILRRVVETALRAPSAGNSQPCEFVVVGGAKLQEIKEAVSSATLDMIKFDIPVSLQYPEPWSSRYGANVKGLQQQLGLTREDKQGRADWNSWGMKLWGAPSCIYLTIDKAFYRASDILNSLNVFDCGMSALTIMLLATEEGLGTIPAIMPVLYPDILRRLLGLPENKLFVLGIPIGYPDPDQPANKFRSRREPLEKMATFFS